MLNSYENPPLRDDLVQELRRTALSGTTVRELVEIVRTRLALNADALIPILAYICKAFRLPMPEILPIREWLGTNDDEAIDALILPAIERNRDGWAPVKSSDRLVAENAAP